MFKTKNILFVLLVFVGSVLMTTAQETNSKGLGIPRSTIKDNWFISIGAGPNLLIGEQDFDVSTGKRIRLGGEVSVGRATVVPV